MHKLFDGVMYIPVPSPFPATVLTSNPSQHLQSEILSGLPEKAPGCPQDETSPPPSTPSLPPSEIVAPSPSGLAYNDPNYPPLDVWIIEVGPVVEDDPDGWLSCCMHPTYDAACRCLEDCCDSVKHPPYRIVHYTGGTVVLYRPVSPHSYKVEKG